MKSTKVFPLKCLAVYVIEPFLTVSFNLPHKTDYNWTYKDDSKKLAVLKKGEYG